MNIGYTEEEIKKLKADCSKDGTNYCLVLDEIEDEENDQYAHFQFVGLYEGKEVIYDTLLQTLALHYNSAIYEEAEHRILKEYPDFLPIELREIGYKVNAMADERVEMIVDEIEEEEEIKVAEYIDIDLDFEFGIGIEASLNYDRIGDKEINDFIKRFTSNQYNLDTTLFTFKVEDDE